MPRLINPPTRAFMHLAGRHNRRQTSSDSQAKAETKSITDENPVDVNDLLADGSIASLQAAVSRVNSDNLPDLISIIREHIHHATALDVCPEPSPHLQVLLKIARRLISEAATDMMLSVSISSSLQSMAADDLVPVLVHSRLNKDVRLAAADLFLDIIRVIEGGQYALRRLFAAGDDDDDDQVVPAWFAALPLNDYARAALITTVLARDDGDDVDPTLFRRMLQFAFVPDVRLRSMSLTALTTCAVRFGSREKGEDLDLICDLIMDAVIYNWNHAFQKIQRCTGPLVQAVLGLLRRRTRQQFCLDLYRKQAPVSRSKWFLLSTMLDADLVTDTADLLLRDLITTAGSPTSWSVVHPLSGQLLTKLFASVPRPEFVQAWLGPLIETLTSDNLLALDHLKSDLLPVLMRIDPGALTSLAAALPPTALNALAAVVISARQAGLGLDEIMTSADLSVLFHHSDLDIVAEAFAFVCTSSRKSALPESRECELATECLDRFGNISRSALRHKVDHHLQQFLLRIRAGAQRLRKRDPTIPESPIAVINSPYPDVIAAQYRFVASLLESSLENIFPGASTDRLLTNLQIIYVITDIWPDWYQPVAIERLLTALLSTWENIRHSALAILYKLHEHHGLLPGYTRPDQLTPLLSWALELLSSSQPSYTQSGSALAQLIFKIYVLGRGWNLNSSWTLEVGTNGCKTVDPIGILTAELGKNISELEQTPIMERYLHGRHRMHGLLMLLADLITEQRAVLDEDLVGDLVKICRRILSVSMDVHAKDSGHEHWLLLEIESVDCRGHVVLKDDDGNAHAQLLVVCSWHAIKQSCHVLAALASRGVLAVDVIRGIGDTFIDTLYTCKHQGVLLNTFLSLEAIAATVPVALLNQWLDRLITDVQAGDSGQWIRRSAGVPFCFRALLHAVQGHMQRQMTEKVLDALLKIASAPEHEWQTRVHALNIVRAVVGDSSLVTAAVSRIASVMILAISGFDSPDWALRNSSLMLFTSSVKMSCSATITGRSFFTAHPELYDFFLDRLKQAIGGQRFSHDSSLHPILLLLSRLQKCASSISKLAPFQSHIECCASHPNILIRQQAARALPVTLQHPKQFVETLLTSRLHEDLTNNHLHGLFLQLLYLAPQLDSPLDPDAITVSLGFCGRKSTSFVVRRCALEAFAALLAMASTNQGSNIILLVRHAMDAYLLQANTEFPGIGYNRLRETAAKVLVQFAAFIESDQHTQLITVGLKSCPNAVHLAIGSGALPNELALELVLLQSLYESPSQFTELLERAMNRESFAFDWHPGLRQYVIQEAATLTDANALRLMGRMQITQRDPRFLEIIGKAINPDQEAECRAAAADALVHAGAPPNECDAVSYWLLVLDLIVDDDEQIRMIACNHLVPSDDDSSRSDPLRSLFNLFERQFGVNPNLSRSLRSRILQLANVPLSLSSSSSVFIIDKRNEYLEPLLLVEHICIFVKASLHKMSSSEQTEWSHAAGLVMDQIGQLDLSSYRSISMDETLFQCLYTSIAVAYACSRLQVSDIQSTISNLHPAFHDLAVNRRLFLQNTTL